MDGGRGAPGLGYLLLRAPERRAARRAGSSRESASRVLAVAPAAAGAAGMDAHDDYVWPRASSELMLLPVTGLECVGERLLAGEAGFGARASGEEAERSRGPGLGTKGCPEEHGRRGPGGGGNEPRLQGPRKQTENSVASEALPPLQLLWKGRAGPRKVQGNAVLLDGGGREVCGPFR